jgi:hypothetical protein
MYIPIHIHLVYTPGTPEMADRFARFAKRVRACACVRACARACVRARVLAHAISRISRAMAAHRLSASADTTNDCGDRSRKEGWRARRIDVNVRTDKRRAQRRAWRAQCDPTSASYGHHAEVAGEEGCQQQRANRDEPQDSNANHDLGKPRQVEGLLVLFDEARVRPRDLALRRLATQPGDVIVRKRAVRVCTDQRAQ